MIDLPYKGIPVDTFINPSKEKFTNLIKEGKPFKVQGCLKNFPLMQDLDMIKNPTEKANYLKGLVQKRIVNYTVLPFEQKGHIRLDKNLKQNFSFSNRKTTFENFINHVINCLNLESNETLYLQASLLTELLDKINTIDLFKGFVPSSQPLFWIGTGNQFVGLHNDPFRNMISVFAGRKRVILFPPEELSNIYPAPFDKRSGGAIASLLDVFNPDFNKFVFFKKAIQKAIIAVLEPGDFLYLPPLWWHAVESEGFNIGLNCWFYDDGQNNQLYQLYTPAESLSVKINQNNLTNLFKNQLYKKFTNKADITYLDLIKSRSVLEFHTLKTSKKIRNIINSSNLSINQKKIWSTWVQVFSIWYVFNFKKNTFPTLSSSEFQNMIDRQKKNKNSLQKSVKKIKNIILKLKFLQFKKKERHALVPD